LLIFTNFHHYSANQEYKVAAPVWFLMSSKLSTLNLIILL
jgi:hypothetical protein